MKKTNFAIITAFLAVLALPLVTFNFEKDSKSEIDNRVLAEDPFTVIAENKKENPDYKITSTEFNSLLSTYISDRIGFRNQFIVGYTELYDKIFKEMKHPIYTYGQDGYVFFKPEENTEYSKFHDEFINMIVSIDRYCKERNVPCYFMFEPSKVTVLQDYLPEGMNYSRTWVDQMLDSLREQNVKVVDNTQLLSEFEQNGTAVFNKQYDAGHWNDLGAYYAVNNLLSTMKEDGIPVEENSLDDFTQQTAVETTLPVSEFPINETVPIINVNLDNITDLHDTYSKEIEINKKYPNFLYRINNEKENSSKLLFFQGSYINGKGWKFVANAFNEYIGVHDYQNMINFDYYYNIFQPDVVVLEVAEYACTGSYFNTDAMKSMDLNPVLNTDSITKEIYETQSGLDIQSKEALTTISWFENSFYHCYSEENILPEHYAWLIVDGKPYDMRKSEDSGIAYTCTLDNNVYKDNSSISVVLGDARNTVLFHIPTISETIVIPEMTNGVSANEFGYHFKTDTPGNHFSNVRIQFQNAETEEFLNPIAVKYEDDQNKKQPYIVYQHCDDSGDYIIRIRGDSNLADEYISFPAYLEQGKTYYFKYTLSDFTDTSFNISDIFFGE